MTTVYLTSGSYFQHDDAPCNKDHILSHWFLETGNEFTVLQWPLQSLDLNPILEFIGVGELHHRYVADKSAGTAECYHVNMDQNL